MTAFITVPCFNEATRWNADYWNELVAMPGIIWTFVDDGSSDTTRELAQSACSGSDSRVMAQSVNQGKAEAVRAGLRVSLADAERADIVGFMDADGAFHPDDIARVISLSAALLCGDEWDAVWTSRVALAGRDIKRSARRHYFGRIAATILSWNDESVPYDTQSGFKLFAPTDLLSECVSVPFETRWLFEMDLLNRYENMAGSSMRIWEEPLMSWRDVPGSKVSSREVLRIGREILAVKRMARDKSGRSSSEQQ